MVLSWWGWLSSSLGGSVADELLPLVRDKHERAASQRARLNHHPPSCHPPSPLYPTALLYRNG